MDDLIEALTIFKKYQKPTQWPTGCLHDELYINGVRRRDVSLEDRKRLRNLAFCGTRKSGIIIRSGSANDPSSK